MQVYCPKCHVLIPVQDINLDSSTAKCVRCNEVFTYELPEVNRALAAKERITEPPKGFTALSSGSDFLLLKRWYSCAVYPLLVFCIFWDGFLAVWYTAAFASGAPLAMKLFPILHLAVGVGLTYLVIAMFVNTTTIKIGSMEVSVSHGPLPWPGNKKLLRGEIDQLFCEEKVHHGKNGTTTTYDVQLIKKGGARITFMTGLQDTREARYIEQVVEERLHLKDRPVSGEVR
jgi:hypothetical protein